MYRAQNRRRLEDLSSKFPWSSCRSPHCGGSDLNLRIKRVFGAHFLICALSRVLFHPGRLVKFHFLQQVQVSITFLGRKTRLHLILPHFVEVNCIMLPLL